MKCIALAGLLLAATTANAQTSRFYLRGDIGLALGTPSVETDTDPGSAIASPARPRSTAISAPA